MSNLIIQYNCEKTKIPFNYWFENHTRIELYKLRDSKDYVACPHNAKMIFHNVKKCLSTFESPFYDPVGFDPFNSNAAIVIPGEYIKKDINGNPIPDEKIYRELVDRKFKAHASQVEFF